MIAIASVSASTDCFGVRSGPPIATIASQNAPAPRPSSTRPPLSTSRLATLLASMSGSRSGRFATLSARRTLVVAAAATDSSVQASRKRRWYGWSWKVTRSSPAASASRASSTTAFARSASGVTKTPNWSSCP